MIKHMDAEKMPELTDEGQKMKKKQQNIQTFKFLACGSTSLKGCKKKPCSLAS